jgi:hypothetical protein
MLPPSSLPGQGRPFREEIREYNYVRVRGGRRNEAGKQIAGKAGKAGKQEEKEGKEVEGGRKRKVGGKLGLTSFHKALYCLCDFVTNHSSPVDFS